MRFAVSFGCAGWSALFAVWMADHNGRHALWELCVAGIYGFALAWLGVWVLAWMVSGPAEAAAQSERAAADQDYWWLHASHRRGRG